MASYIADKLKVIVGGDEYTMDPQLDLSSKVTGPANAVNNHVPTFDGTTGKIIKDSGYTIGKSVPSNAVFTDTTYSSKPAAGGGTDVSLVTTGEKYNWNAKTSNTGTVTKVSTGAGLTGGDITTSGTVKANLKSETRLANTATDGTETAGRVYPVRLDSNGKLAVNVPWQNTTYSSKQAASGGTDASLVTTGEKYNWNNKPDATVVNAIGTIITNSSAGYGGRYMDLPGGMRVMWGSYDSYSNVKNRITEITYPASFVDDRYYVFATNNYTSDPANYGGVVVSVYSRTRTGCVISERNLENNYLRGFHWIAIGFWK